MCSRVFPCRIGFFFFFQAEDGIRDIGVTGVQTCVFRSTLLLLSATLIVTCNLTTGVSIEQVNAVTTTSTGAINPSLRVYNGTIPSAESVYSSEGMSLPASVGSFVIYIADEAHENTATASWKHVSDHNPTYIPTNLVI